MAKVLMVLTSHDRLGETGQPTGFWLEELAAPYYVLKDAGTDITLASPKGGQPPVDPKSDDPKAQTPAMQRFRKDPEAQRARWRTRPGSRRCQRATTTRSSIRAATGRCGIWRRTGIPFR
jgi:putative intracellular protease/amidase